MAGQRGFTLLELLISVALSSALVILASHIYETINQAGNKALTTGRDWGAQQFMRQQFAAADSGLNGYFLAVKAESGTFSFVSRNSAQFGKTQRPVLATYKYDSAARALLYRETILPPWWDENQEQYQAQIESYREWKGAGSYEAPLFSGLDNVRLEFWDMEHKRWIETWNSRKNTPSLARWTLTSLGRSQQIVLAPGALSLSSVYGF